MVSLHPYSHAAQAELLLAGVPSTLVFGRNEDYFSTKTLMRIVSVYYVNIKDVIAKQAGVFF